LRVNADHEAILVAVREQDTATTTTLLRAYHDTALRSTFDGPGPARQTTL
jgi:hypothetical protein